MFRSKLAGGAAVATVLGFLSVSAAPAVASAPGGDFPPNAEPGKCYEKVLIPPSYESYTEQIIDIPGRTETRVIPAVYGEEVRQVLVREERVEYITVPATYRTVTETVVLKAATVRTETVAAVYETITERVLVKEAHYEWRRGVPAHERPTEPGKTKVLATGEVLCLVEVPAEYSMVTRQILKSPARTVEIQVPAETQVVTRQVIDQDARVEKRVIPAEYRSVRVRVVITAEHIETYTVQPVYKTVTKQRMVTDTTFQWRQITCNYDQAPPPPRYSPPPAPPRYDPPTRPTTYNTPQQPMPYGAASSSASIQVSPRLVRDMQSALGMRGYYSGPRNGVMSSQTQNALTRFQIDRKLDTGRVTSETLLALGVPIP